MVYAILCHISLEKAKIEINHPVFQRIYQDFPSINFLNYNACYIIYI